jgi:hypothetical protein
MPEKLQPPGFVAGGLPLFQLSVPAMFHQRISNGNVQHDLEGQVHQVSEKR